MRRATAAAALLGLLAAGCRSLQPPPIPLEPDDPRPARYLAALEERAAELRALRGMAQLAVDGPGGSLRSKQVLVAARPARLRVEVLGFLSQTVALLATDGESYELFDTRAQRFERDRLRPGLLWEVAGLDLEPAEAVRLLLAEPETEPFAPAGAALLPDGGLRLALLDPQGRLRRGLEFDAEGGLRRLAAWNEAGDLALDVRYGDVQWLGALRFAHAIELDFPVTGVRARLELSQVDLNPELPAGTFRLRRPAGASRGAERGEAG